MLRPEFIARLRCLENGSPLTLADSALIAKLNQAVAEKTLKNRGGQVIEKPLESGLVRADGKLLYVISDDIPIMLSDEAVDLE